MLADALSRRLADIAAQHRRSRGHIAVLYDQLVGSLEASEVLGSALKVGDIAPDFALPNAEGQFITLGDLLTKGHVVLSFYRGSWCPFCQCELEALREAHDEIVSAGGQVAVITGEAGGRGFAAKEAFGLPFQVLLDIDLGVSLSFGLVFRVPTPIRAAYLDANLDLEFFNGNDSWFLPVPATYVIAPDHTIISGYVDPDFRSRMEPAAIIAALRELSPTPERR